MKYFFLAFTGLVAFTIGVFGFRGGKTIKTPIEIFPDMDRMDFVQSQRPSDFFHDGLGARLPVAGTVPHASDDGVFPVEFGEGRSGHYYTGAINDYFANGLPLENLGLIGEDATSEMQALLRRGQDRFSIFCAICHGESGDGTGTISDYMAAKIANLHEVRFGSDQYPDGKLYHVITYGQGLMGGYGASIPVRDRWAIVAYVRALQDSRKAPAPVPLENDNPAGGSIN
ncbi:MAG: cytochrome C [Roseibacillus sp.]|jgi:mono/diheme cytochrome c family protein|nr:cytochrome C [Roseibacillus sp.]MBP35874.1 cytochrome C [Roseibacillus sp.]MCP4729387.1 cytochrome c [Roseibacillus sp.]MDP7309463.1 cytochrome c [Roseibacillus sp.]HJM64760.1 cytochrome c [Roseibacillus sp.]|tara:strand:+ start:4671 stop:5354 length:684 start_codon:yes stop_codon:yes gene_type:complete